MNVIATSIPDVLIVEPKIFGGTRGFFMETNAERCAANGIGARFVQDNLSRSAIGVLRGLHIQNPRPQGKLVTVLRGAISGPLSKLFAAGLSTERNRQACDK